MGDLLVPITLQVLGVIIILAEFLLPSGGILTICASGVFGYSLYLVFTTMPKEVGFIFVGADIITIPIAILIGIKILAYSPVALKKTLGKKEGVTSQDLSLEKLVGKEGMVINDLRPAGRVEIDNVRYDVVSSGDYISKGATIEIISITGNTIVVKNKEI